MQQASCYQSAGCVIDHHLSQRHSVSITVPMRFAKSRCTPPQSDCRACSAHAAGVVEPRTAQRGEDLDPAEAGSVPSEAKEKRGQSRWLDQEEDRVPPFVPSPLECHLLTAK